ncbi:MAG: hypothetical protein LC749_12120 [Actinobacteria bacterium]|nr:hypothetical protein [Actinomycetota bacterium]
MIVDPKGSPALADTVCVHRGKVWTLDGKLPADLLDRARGRCPICCPRPRITARMRACSAMQRTSGPSGQPARSPYKASRWSLTGAETPELLERMGVDVLGKVDRRWSKHDRELEPCLVRRASEPTYKAAGGLYRQIYDPVIKRSDYAHRIVWRRVHGAIRRG